MARADPRFCVYVEFSEEETAALLKATDEADIKLLLAEVVDWEPATKASVVVELLFYTLALCRDHRLDTRTTSALLGIMLRRVKEDAGDFSITATSSSERFRAAVMAHSVERSPGAIGVLSEEAALQFVAWATSAYYRSFHLYKHVLAARPSLQMRQTTAGETAEARRPPPLHEASQVE